MDIKKAIQNNGPALCSATAIVATTTSLVLTAKGTIKAYEILEENKADGGKDPEPVEVAKLIWKEYIPAAVTFSIAVIAVIGINKSYNRQIAGVVSAAAVSEQLMREYLTRVEDRLTSDDLQEIRDEMAQEHVTNETPKNSEVIFVGDGDALFRDGISGRYFMSTKNEVEANINEFNRLINSQGYATLTDLYELLGLEQTNISDDLGWSAERGLLNVHFGAAMTADGRPCLELSFRDEPYAGYNVWN